MKKKITIVAVAILLIAILILLTGCSKQPESKTENKKFKIVTSFYPMYIATLNITEGANDVELLNMTENNGSCIHDYTLNTQDLVKLEGANVLIENGLEMENFSDKILQTYNEIEMIDASRNLTNLLKNGDRTNGHVWTSIQNHMNQVETIADRLSEMNPENREVYQKNKETYRQKLQMLQQEYATKLADLKGKTAVSLDESFDYLGTELGMKVLAVQTDHEESTLSGEALTSLVDRMRQEKVTIIFVGENDSAKSAQVIANETGATIYRLNSAMTGERNKDQYLDAMRINLEVLKQIK